MCAAGRAPGRSQAGPHPLGGSADVLGGGAELLLGGETLAPHDVGAGQREVERRARGLVTPGA